MGYSILAVGDVVRIGEGDYAGAIGVVGPPTVDAEQYATERAVVAMMFPVTVATVIDGVAHTVRVPADILTRVIDPRF